MIREWHSKMPMYQLSSMVRGYHGYVDIMFIKIPIQATSWTVYERPPTAMHDPYAVAVSKSGFAVGHVPQHFVLFS